MGAAAIRYASGWLKSSSAARTAAITNAENVQSFPWIACSTASTTSFGKRMVLFVVGGVEGILKLPTHVTSQYICTASSLHPQLAKVCIANAMQLWYYGMGWYRWQNSVWIAGTKSWGQTTPPENTCFLKIWICVKNAAKWNRWSFGSNGDTQPSNGSSNALRVSEKAGISPAALIVTKPTAAWYTCFASII